MIEMVLLLLLLFVSVVDSCDGDGIVVVGGV